MYAISLIPKENMHSILPLVKLLNEDKTEELLRSRLDEMLTQGYQCAGVYDTSISLGTGGKKLIGISGIWIMTKLYVGKHFEPDNVVIDPEYRNKGVGELLMKWLYDYGKSQGCIATELNCYVQNIEGQKFWEKEGYKPLGIHYQKKF
jgi:GNAT superfamily N-acetyltransferase